MSEQIVPFKRGTTFNFVMTIPEDIPDGTLASWLPCAQLRRDRNSSPSGLIGKIETFWADPAKARVLIFHHNETEKWPLGLAEMDVVFTSTGGQTIRSSTVKFDIQRGISHAC